jgi:2-methylfumaryl-CoA isomerase
MNRLLHGIRVIEAASFIAAPSCALHLAQFGAHVIRIDPIGGGPDFHRWPLAPRGQASLYWEGLNQSKHSIAIDLARAEGRALAIQIITAPGEQAGLFVTNYPADGFLGYAELKKRRPDLACVRIMGWPDGQTAVDYTVNAAVGVPAMTGPMDDPRPVNHVLPAWDLMAGAYAAFTLVSLELARRQDGQGREVRIALADIAMASLGYIGQIGEVQTGGADRARMGNQLFGAFGRDFETLDGKRVMVVALTSRQWRGLLAALNLETPVSLLESSLGVRFDQSEGVRFQYREVLTPLVERAVKERSAAQIAAAFGARDVCWAPYQRLSEALASNRFSSAPNALLSSVEHPSGYRYLTPGAPASISSETRGSPVAAPPLGRDTVKVLSEVLNLSNSEIDALHDKGVVASA